MSNEKRLTRSRTDKMIGGVCGGIGAYFNIDPTLVRIGFAALVLIGIGSPILLYLLLWIIMPAANSPRALTETPTATTANSAPVAQLEVRTSEDIAPESIVQPSAAVDTDAAPHTEPADDMTPTAEERVVQM